MKNNKAFTLAEVLITLMIIGILAVVTIPSIIQSWEERATVSKLKKIYSTLQEAYSLTEGKYGDINSWGDNNSDMKKYREAFAKKFSEEIPIAKDCKLTASGCFPDIKYLYLNNGDPDFNIELAGHIYKVLLLDGSSLGVHVWKCNTTDCARIYYDTNGLKPPNIFGRDLFEFAIGYQNRVVPLGGMQNGSDTVGDSYHQLQCSSTSKSGTACARWVIERGNMDYLHKSTTW